MNWQGDVYQPYGKSGLLQGRLLLHDWNGVGIMDCMCDLGYQ